MRILVSSASGPNGNGYGAILVFSMEGEPLGEFGKPGSVTDPRGMSVHPDGQSIFVNLGDDRVRSFSRGGDVIADTGVIQGLNPGGGQFGTGGDFYAGLRTKRTIMAFDPSFSRPARKVLPELAVPFPRGFAMSDDGTLFLASGIGPTGEGDNTVVVFGADGSIMNPRLVDDPKLSPLDLTLAPNGNVVVSSEHPFGVKGAMATLREYDAKSGDLVREFAPRDPDAFVNPRGIRFGPDGRLYCVSRDQIVVFDFNSGLPLGCLVQLGNLNGQAIEFF